MKQYLELLLDVVENGLPTPDRTGIGIRSVFGRQIRVRLGDGFPLLTTKRVHLRSVIHELLWMLMGDTNIEYLKSKGVSIWDEWADARGDLGPVYGEQWREWKTGWRIAPIDQIAAVIEGIKTNPYSRRHIVSAWNVTDLEDMALPPCHMMFQFDVREGMLNCHMYQRSADIFLGVPFNIASYALLTMMVAQVCRLQPGELVISFGNLHLYSTHETQAQIQLSRVPLALPRMKLNPEITDIDDFQYEDFTILEYNPLDAILAPVAV